MSKQWRFCVKLAREILFQKFKNKMSNRSIGRLHFISKSTVAVYLKRALDADINSLDKLNAIDDEDLKKIIFYNPSQREIYRNIILDFNYIKKELTRKNMTLMLIWKELGAGQECFYKYSQFCYLFRAWLKSKDLSMKMTHKAGEKLFIDYAGTTVPVVINLKTGEEREAQIFVACLGASQYTYIEATWGQTTREFINSNIHAFEFFGGAPELLVPDNLKSAVNLASKYEPVLNQSYRAMAKYYNCAVAPARAYRPKDKAKVENSVQLVSRWILARIRNQKFFSLEELNKTLWELLEELNNQKFQKLDDSRRSLFEALEKEALSPLNTPRYAVAEWKKVRVNINYHIELERCFYSVPYRHIHQELDCRYTDTTVEFFINGSRITSHARAHKAGFTSTNREHMPKSHQQHLEWPPSRMLAWGSTIGPFTECCFKQLMERSEHPELAYKSCLGIIGLEKKYQKERTEKACERAFKLRSVSYRSIKLILENNLDQIKIIEEEVELEGITEHENLRGKNYYQ